MQKDWLIWQNEVVCFNQQLKRGPVINWVQTNPEITSRLFFSDRKSKTVTRKTSFLSQKLWFFVYVRAMTHPLDERLYTRLDSRRSEQPQKPCRQSIDWSYARTEIEWNRSSSIVSQSTQELGYCIRSWKPETETRILDYATALPWDEGLLWEDETAQLGVIRQQKYWKADSGAGTSQDP